VQLSTPKQKTAAALKVADRALVMERSRIALSGDSRELLGNVRLQQAYLGRVRGAQPAASL